MDDGPDTGYQSWHEPRDEDHWAHEMSDPPEDPNAGRWFVRVEGVFDTEAQADEAFNAMEDAVGKNNGDLMDSEVTPWEEA